MSKNAFRLIACAAAAWLAMLASAGKAWGQRGIEVEAVVGEPFGIGRMSLQLPGPAADGSLLFLERGGRAYYPAYQTVRPVRKLLREMLAVPPRITVYFLFTGDEPLDLTLYTPAPYSQRVTPRRDPGAFQGLLRARWKEYPANDARDVKTYLNAMLAERLGLPHPGRDRPARDEFSSALGLLTGSEWLRLQWQQDVVFGTADKGQADRPLPQPMGTRDPESVPVAPQGKVTIEAIANHVPEECFYVHFGSFENFQWLSHRIDEWGGGLRNTIADSGVDYGLHDRMNRQLALRESVLSNLLGPQVISDVALVGTDLFLNEGASLGILFQARSGGALATDIGRQRIEALQKEKGASEQKIKIGDHEVSLISTPDNALRSFYAVDGDFHLVTTSRRMAERFLEAGQGQGSLGTSAEFADAHAGGAMSMERHNAANIYLSRAFFRNLAGPHYRVEMMRRMRALAEIEVVALARLAARSEKQPAQSLEDLIKGQFLPREFGRRPDGSRLVFRDDGVFDSVRGGRGTFTPVSDVPVKAVTPAEAESYARFAGAFAKNWEQMNPVVVGVHRTPNKKPGLERVVLDAKVNVTSGQNDFLSGWLGAPSAERIAPTPGDLVFLEAVVSAKLQPGAGDYHLFLALRDTDSREDPDRGIIAVLLGQNSNLRGYIGAWPHPGVLRLLAGGDNIPIDASGFSHLPNQAWRRVFDQFTMLSFHREVLEEAAPKLKVRQAAAPAQFWLHTDDLRNSKLADTINGLGYRRASQISQENVRLMHSMVEQFHVPADRCLATAESMLHARLVCPLGGRYELRDVRGTKAWTSTALNGAPPGGRPPENYEFPALKWFRGVDAEMRLIDSVLALHVEADMPAKVESAFRLPTAADLFGPNTNKAGPQKKPTPTPPELPKPRDAE